MFIVAISENVFFHQKRYITKKILRDGTALVICKVLCGISNLSFILLYYSFVLYNFLIINYYFASHGDDNGIIAAIKIDFFHGELFFIIFIIVELTCFIKKSII